MSRDSRRAFERALAKLELPVRRAFLQAISDVRSTAQARTIQAAIERGDLSGVLRALDLGEEFFAPLDDALREAFIQGAEYQLDTLPKRYPAGGGGPLVVRFQGRLPRAENIVSTLGGTLIREILQDQREMIAEAVRSGVERGQGAATTALDIIGRPDAQGRRVGGLIGLTTRQAGYIESARTELEALDATYFTRSLRDKRFDRTVRKAISEDRALSSADIAKITGRYSDRMLKMRGNMIARTETIKAMNAGRLEAMQQMVDSGKVPESAVKKVWDATGDSRTRISHMVLEGQTAPLNGAFVSQTGGRMLHPGDTSLGASGEDVIGCRCYMKFDIDWLSLAR